MVDLLYRLLGAALGARRVLFAGAALVGVALWVLVLRGAGTDPTPGAWLAAVALPLLYGLAGWVLFHLPPGVVFRAARQAAGEVARPTARCRASGYFPTRRGRRWRLLARASVAFAPDGSVVATSPPPLLGGPQAAQQAFPSRGRPTDAQIQAGQRTPFPEWIYQQNALVGSTSQRTYQSAEEYAAAVAQLSVPRAALRDLVVGWQYAGLNRWPAIRLAYYEPSGELASGYLAFAEPEHCAWARDRLMGRGD